jgi:hypothetical protein
MDRERYEGKSRGQVRSPQRLHSWVELGFLSYLLRWPSGSMVEFGTGCLGHGQCWALVGEERWRRSRPMLIPTSANTHPSTRQPCRSRLQRRRKPPSTPLPPIQPADQGAADSSHRRRRSRGHRAGAENSRRSPARRSPPAAAICPNRSPLSALD